MSPLLEIENLIVAFPQRGWGRSPTVAVDDVSLSVRPGETVGLVGESGSGKSTVGRAVLGLARASAGRISFDGRDITHASQGERRGLASSLQAVFQDPFSSLDPLMPVGRSIAEPLEGAGQMDRAERVSETVALLDRVGLPAASASRLPSQFSGGQRQRVAIARALSVRPRLAICDEPTSALDLSTQAQVLNLLKRLQSELGLAYLFIAHHLAVVQHVSDRVVVLYRGRVMESGSAADVCARPLHPYSVALWAAAPVIDPVEQALRRAARRLTVPSRTEGRASQGCPFAPRCPHAAEVCWSHRPADTSYAGRTLACHMFDSGAGHPRSGNPPLPEAIA